MILTVTLNAAVDRTYRIPHFELDRVHRPSKQWVTAGGKGINVARVLHTLGAGVVTTGILGGQSGEFILKSLEQSGIASHFVKTRGDSRLCIAVIDEITGSQTEINEVGPCVSHSEVEQLEQTVAELIELHRCDYVALSGSVPPGVDDRIYARLISIVNKSGARAVLDSSGTALREAIEARPWLVKPNRYEMASLIGQPDISVADIPRAIEWLQRRGIPNVALTLGAVGALLCAGDWIGWAKPPKVTPISAVGCGDSFVGGFLYGMSQRLCPTSALAIAMGAAAANLESYGAALMPKDLILKRSKNVTIQEIGMGEIGHAILI
ncbi:MAG: 1-phosphofructokinase family hexose kinase [Armatimonadetes bacterium]|nr:1-phosphofructokinase family hexose kinase [Armatimonadota bacterium]